MTPGRPASSARRRLLLALAFASTVGACRQTVILDPSERGDGGGAGASAFDATGGGGAGGRPDGGGAGGGAGSNRDGGRFDLVPLCPGGGLIQQLPITLRAPDVIFVVDRSASMQTWFGEGTRLQVAQSQVLALILKYQRAVRFGYQEFPSSNGMCNNGLGCCAGEVTPPTGMSFNAIQHVITDCGNGGNGCVQLQRPTADALAKCNRTFMSLNSNGRGRYVVVLTGGEPTCGGSPDGGASACDTALKAVTDLNHDQDVYTAIFGIGDEAAGSACLSNLADRGGLGSTGKAQVFHLELTPTDLNRALDSVVGTMAAEACHIDVRSPPADPASVQLMIGNVKVPVDGVDGWTFDPGGNLKITVRGSWCDTLIQQMRGSSVELVSGCPTGHP